ncbi:hypothetical protein F4808DRAFT_256299 [Astrocystis sublimbata]|nr:hypothetical protein F4808DRAFT_256299 [Astrocystis sublimbata]
MNTNMGNSKDIDYKSIGAGFQLAAMVMASSPNELDISLSDDSPTLKAQHELHSCHSTTYPTSSSEPEGEGPSEIAIRKAPFPTRTNHDQPLQDLTPLERYCCHIEPYEQLVMGRPGEYRSLRQLGEINNSLDAATKVLGETEPQASGSSNSSLTSSVRDANTILAVESDPMKLQAEQDLEQAKQLRMIAKRNRRIRAEGSPRQMKSVRVRKRSKSSNTSIEDPVRGDDVAWHGLP